MSPRGVVSAGAWLDWQRKVDIVLEPGEYRVGTQSFVRAQPDATIARLREYTGEVLHVFAKVEDAVVARDSLELDPVVCHARLVELAKWGSLAYKVLLEPEAREILVRDISMREAQGLCPVPTVIAGDIPFPWEVIYDGDDDEEGDPEGFWGLRYAPARVLDGRDVFSHVAEQARPLDMLFCLHHRLLRAKEQEYPNVERAVRSTSGDRFTLLRAGGSMPEVRTGRKLLGYLDTSDHTMVHFACHCREGPASGDVLEVSWMGEALSADGELIELETHTFTQVENGRFQCQPLVFLNACRSAGGGDALRTVVNLPSAFIGRGAAAVVATACAVPDEFAAAFARRFYELFLCPGREDERPVIADALRAVRREFLTQAHNPLGLAYGLYSPAHYKVGLGSGG